MARLLRRALGTKKRGAALLAALQLTALILIGILSFLSGPKESSKGPAETQASASSQNKTQAEQNQTDQPQTETTQPITAKDLTAAEKSALRKSAHLAEKLYEPLASQVFSLQRSRVELQAAQRSSQGPESPNTEPTLTTDREDYAPFTYVYITGTGFQPGETVNMIVVELDPTQQSFEPWDVVADENGNFQTSWYIFSYELVGATMQVTATGQSSQLTASATFTDAGCGIALNGDLGGFEVSGNVVAAAAPHTDWVDTTPGTNGLVNPTTGVPLDATVTYRVLDPYTGLDDVFKGGNNKINNDPNTYLWDSSGPNSKTDMNNVYVHISVDSNSHRWVTASADRESTSGAAYVDFELNQATVTRVTDVVCSGGGTAPCGHFETSPLNATTGGRTPNDLLVTAQYASGSGTFFVLQWQLLSGTWQWVDITSSIAAAGAFACTNTGSVSVPYGAFGATTYPANQFVEMSIDLTALITALDPCSGIEIKTVFVKTKTSNSTSAQLEDFALPIPVSFSSGFVVTGSKTDPACSFNTGSVCATWTQVGGHTYDCKLDSGSFAGCTSPQCYTGLAPGSTHTIYVRDNNTNCVKDTGALTLGTGDTTNPTIGSPGADNTVQCPASPSFTAPTASDNSGSVTVTNLGDTTSGNQCTLVTTRSWRAVDGCGNTSGTVSQRSTRVDTTPPTIGGQGGNATIECPATPTFTAPTASDTCTGATVNQVSDTSAAGTCANNFTRTKTWRAVDGCGNTSGTVSQTITVRDTTAPAIGGQGSNATIECPATPSFTAPTASDACGGSTVQDLGATTTAGTCANNYTSARSWKAVDACGNTSGTVTQTITVRDTTGPVIGAAGSNATIQCPATPSFTAPTASDACGTSTVVQDSDTTAAGTCTGTYSETKTWHAVDACGNTSVSRNQTITVADTTPPAIGGQGSNATIECPASPSFTAPTASDTCSGATVQDLGATTTAGTCANNYTSAKSWKAVDGCGNTSGTVTQTITVRDTTVPTIGSAGSNATIECPASPSFTAPTASDACGGTTVQNLGDTTTAGTCANNYTSARSWNAVDACGNTSVTRTQIITVRDTTAPTIGGQGSNATIECPASPTFTAPTASDACGGSTVVNDGDTTAAGTCANDYSTTRSWHAIDACGNTSGTVTQTVLVRDTTAPTIGGQGSNATIECPASPSFTSPTSSDTCNASSVVEDSDTSAAGTCQGTYTRTKTWHAVDNCGNTSSQVHQTITVEDHTPPTIGGQGSDATIECPATPSFTSPTSSDTCNESSVVEDSDTSAAGTCQGTYTRTKTWHAVDNCGNTSNQVHQTITVEDITPPSIGGQGSDATIECPASPSFTSPTSSDTCNTSSVVEDSDTSAQGTCAGTYTRTKTWHAVDNCGNTSTQVHQTITVEDHTPPTIGGQGGDATIECPATPSFTSPTSSDTCNASSVVEDGDTSAAGTCQGTYTRTKTWHAVDNCGNTSTQVHQTITVEDHTPPSIGGQGGIL